MHRLKTATKTTYGWNYFKYITTDIIKFKVSVLGQASLACPIFSQSVRLHPLIDDMSLNPASNSSVHIMGKVMIFVQLGEFHGRVHFHDMNNLHLLCSVGTSMFDRSVKEIFPIERHIFSIQSQTVASIPEYAPPMDLLGLLHSYSNAETSTDNIQDNIERAPLFKVTNYFAFLPNAETSVSVTTSIAKLVYIPPHPDSIQNRMVPLPQRL